MIRRWQKRIPLLETHVKREMEKVERAFAGAFNWHDFLFPNHPLAVPLKKPGEFHEALHDALSGCKADSRFDRIREAYFA
jgi:hypothetical protein